MPDSGETTHPARLRICMRVNNVYTHDMRVRREAEALAAAGHHVAVVADAGPGLPDSETLAGVPVTRIRKSSRIPYWSIVRPLRDAAADVYHAHDIDSLLPCLIAARLVRPRARVVYDSHELWSAHAADKLHAKRRMLVRFEGAMLRAADALISVSPEITAAIAKHHRFRGPAVTLLNCPRVWTDGELATAWAARDADPLVRIVAAAVFQEGRGAVPLIEALAHLPTEHVVELIGPIVQPDYEQRVLAAAAPFGDRVRLAGRIPTEEVVPRIAASTLSAVLIEPISESYRMVSPNKLFESFAAGTPVIASDLPTLGRITREQDAGEVCDPTDPADIARAVTAALARIGELREHARAAAARYNWDVEKPKLLALYERLGSRSANGGGAAARSTIG